MAQIQLRRDTSAAWAGANPVLAAGEVGVDTTTGQLRIGDGATAWTALRPSAPYDIGYRQTAAVRAVGTGDLPAGLRMARPVVLTAVTYRADTADASGTLVVELRRNGVALADSSATIAAANQVVGGTATGSWTLAAGDILTVHTTAVGTTPGKGLTADITGWA